MTDFESLVWHGWRKENLDTQEIAEKIGVTEAAVFNALGRAREKQMRRAA